MVARSVVEVSRNGSERRSGKRFAAEQRTDERFAEKIVLVLSAAMLCN